MSGAESVRLRKQVRATRKRLQQLDTPWAKSHDDRLRRAEQLLDANIDRLTAEVKRTKRREAAEEVVLCRELYAKCWRLAAKDGASVGVVFPTEPDERDEVVNDLTERVFELTKDRDLPRYWLIEASLVLGGAVQELERIDAALAPIESSVRGSYRALSCEHECAEAALEEGAEVPPERFPYRDDS